VPTHLHPTQTNVAQFFGQMCSSFRREQYCVRFQRLVVAIGNMMHIFLSFLGIEINSLEQPTKMVSAAELAPSDNSLSMLHEAHHKTSDDDIPSSVAMDTWQAKVDSNAACQSEEVCADETAKQSDASLPYSEAPGDDKDIPDFTKEDDSCLCSEGTRTSVDMTDSNQGNVNDSNNTTEDATRQPMEETSASLKDSALNKQSCTPQFEDDPAATTQTTIESDKATGDADIISSGRLDSSGIEIDTVGIQQTEETPTDAELAVASHTEALVEQTQEASAPNKEEIIDSVVLKQDCNIEPCGDAAVAREATEEMDHSAERPVSELAETRTEPSEVFYPKQNQSVPAERLENDCSRLKYDDSTSSAEHIVAPEPIDLTPVMQVEHEATEKLDGYCTAAGSGPSSEAIMELKVHEKTSGTEAIETIAGVRVSKDPESHVSEVLHEATEKVDVYCTAAESCPEAIEIIAGVKVSKDPESHVSEVEHEATEKEDVYCTDAGNSPSEAIMELKVHETTPAAEANETIAGVEVCKDPESHVSGEVSMAVESSDLSSASAIQSDTLNISTHVPVLYESTDNRSHESHQSHMEQQTEMVSATVPTPTGNKEITQGNFLKCTHTHSAVLVLNEKNIVCCFYFH
jgi:hypothetical protein